MWGVCVGIGPAEPPFLRLEPMLDTTTTTDEWLSLPDVLKATPSTEGGQRWLYLEASNEARDYQGEVVLAKALAGSAGYFERYGNFDIQHRSMIGLANNDPDYHLHEIGRPEKVEVDGTRTFVKGIIFQGDTPVAECANKFWDSITKLKPAQRWYPSIGGKIQAGSAGSEQIIDQRTGASHRVIKAMIWANIGFSRTPVNPRVPTISTVPFGILAKCWGTAGLNLTKALEAGYGTDSATLTGGGALREQSLDKRPQTYWEIREVLAAAILGGSLEPSEGAMAEHLTKTCDIKPSEAGEHVQRFLSDLSKGASKNG